MLFRSPESKNSFVDQNHNSRPDVGDVVLTGSELYSWAGSKRGAHVGSLRVICTSQTTAAAHCQATLMLPAGTLQLAGYLDFAKSGPQTIAVVGGTGTYAGARGTLSAMGIGRSSKSSDTIVLLP